MDLNSDLQLILLKIPTIEFGLKYASEIRVGYRSLFIVSIT